MSARPPLARHARSRRERTLVCAAVIAAASAALAYEGWTLAEDHAFNRALEQARFEDAARHRGARGAFAHAYLLQLDGELDAALEHYTRAGKRAAGGLELTLRYNLANLYLQKALSAEGGESDQVRLPLVELAKEGYRDVLREEPRHWPARYNLSRALSLVPDLLEIAEEEDRMPERSPRAPQEARAHDRLP